MPYRVHSYKKEKNHHQGPTEILSANLLPLSQKDLYNSDKGADKLPTIKVAQLHVTLQPSASDTFHVGCAAGLIFFAKSQLKEFKYF